MTIRGKHFFLALIAALAACANVAASGLPAGDSLFIQLDPSSGAVHGLLGATVGWGFTVTWTSTNDWISFTGSSLGSVAPGGNESNSSVLDVYTDYIGYQGGPVDFSIPPSSPPVAWTETFDESSQQGIGAYQITSDPTAVGAEDTGQITIDYDVTNGDPLLLGSVDLGAGSYYGPSTAFIVTVDETSVPEPSSFGLLLSGAAALGVAVWRGRRNR
jgi:hypothetical protein